MNIPALIIMLERRLVYLGQLKTSAAALGDVAQVQKLDEESAETQATLNQLLTLV